MLCCLIIHFKIIVQDEFSQLSTSQDKLLDAGKVNIYIVFYKRIKSSLKTNKTWLTMKKKTGEKRRLWGTLQEDA